MGGVLSRTVKIRIRNKTRNITLKNHSTYFNCGYCYDPPLPEVPPGSTDTCSFLGSRPIRGVAGVLVYEAESFTLAIYFSNPMHWYINSMELGLELSLSKAHLGKVVNTYIRMAKGGSCSNQDTTFGHVRLRKNYGTTQVSAGPVKVTATMSYASDAVLTVVLEEQEGSGQEAEIEVPCPGKHVQEEREPARSSGGTSWAALELCTEDENPAQTSVIP